MIGKTNSSLSNSDLLVESVRIRLLSNQPSHEGLVGSGFTLSYETFTKDYEWDGNEIYVQVPSHLEYTIAFHAVDGYKAPNMVTYTASGGDERDIVGIYYTELLTVNVSADEGTVSEYKITISKGTSVTQTTATGTYKIPHGTSYTVSASSVNGYTSPSKITRVASEASYVAFMQYEKIKHGGTKNPSYGVYIKDTDGYFHTESEWNGTYTADCVAVIADTCQFGIALKNANSKKALHNDASEDIGIYMTRVIDDETAKRLYSGSTYTTAIMKKQSSTTYAAGYCNAFTFPSGKKGYLPAAGQMYITYNNLSAIDAALTKAGGVAITNSRHWTSTYFGMTTDGLCYFYVFRISNGILEINTTTNTYYVRPFCSIS